VVAPTISVAARSISSTSSVWERAAAELGDCLYG